MKDKILLWVTVIVLFVTVVASCSKLAVKTPKKEEKVSVIVKKTEIASQEIVKKEEIQEETIEDKKVVNAPRIIKYCKKMDKKFRHWGWGKSGCEKIQWKHVRYSVLGDPLMWTVFGNEAEHKAEKKNCTMFFCGIHGDETTTIKFCFDIINSLKKRPNSFFKDRLVVVSPLVNPDGFFRRRPTRTNHRGVDVNRNFPTKDWHKDALRLWKKKYRRDKRRYPGSRPLSEPETVFHVNIIKRYRPEKIVSMHAPLSLLDYDGPSDMKGKSMVASMASNLLLQMSESSKNYRVEDYPFFPGSLGNWAGNERDIPTYTLELPTTDSRKSKYYWLLFKDAIYAAIEKDIHGFNQALKVSTQKIDKKADITN